MNFDISSLNFKFSITKDWVIALEFHVLSIGQSPVLLQRLYVLS